MSILSLVSARMTFAFAVIGVSWGLATSSALSATTLKRCPSFVAFRGGNSDGSRFHYPATRVKRAGPVSCGQVRRMIRSTYGAPGGYRRAYPKDDDGRPYGRITVYWRGGWRCSNGAGGAGCSNVKHSDWQVSANVEYADG